MKYPIDIERKIREIELLVNSWPIKKNVDEVINWMLQFDSEDFDLAFRILKNLNVIGPEELNSALAISYSKLNRQAKIKGINLSLKNTMYASIGGASKSGAMISYNFRLINELASANFLDEDSIKYIEEGKTENLVLIDDIIATGDQSSKELKEIAERVIPLGVKNIFVLTAIGFKSGIRKIQATELADVFSALEYDEQDTVTSLDAHFYEGLSYTTRKLYLERFARYRGLGYGGLGALIAFYYNTPNCTINSLWSESHGWFPLFPRVSNVSGINKHYPELDNAVLKSKSKEGPENSLTIFVEGKSVELFFELIGKKYEQFGYEKLSVISIGPFFSDKLIKSLHNISKNYVLITEKESEQTAHSRRVQEIVPSELLLYIDNLINYFDKDKILEEKLFNVNTDDKENLNTYLDLKLFRKAPSTMRQANLELLVDKYLNKEKAEQLIESIKAKVKKDI